MLSIWWRDIYMLIFTLKNYMNQAEMKNTVTFQYISINSIINSNSYKNVGFGTKLLM